MKLSLKSLFVIGLVAVSLASCSKITSSKPVASTTTASSGTASPAKASETPSTPTKNKAQINIATASIGGAYYAVGQEIANLVTKYSDTQTMSPEVTGGAVENPRLLASEDDDFGISNANIVYAAYVGESPYEQKLPLLAVGNLHPSVFHIITLASSPITTLKDLKGKKVAVGPAGGGTLPILEVLLEKYGLSLNDITPSYLSYSDGFNQLADGNVDVALALSGYPASSVMEVAATKKIRFITIDQDIMQSIHAEYPYYTGITVPKEDYKLDEDSTALGIANTLIVRANMDENTVYLVTKAVYDHLEEFGANNATAKQIDGKIAMDTIIPLHAGAQKYWDEKK